MSFIIADAADDIQLYVFVKPGELLQDCLNEISAWMSHNFLQLNHNKTKVLFFAQNQSFDSLKQRFGSLASNSPLASRNPGVIFDSQLNFQKLFKSATQSYFHLRNFSKLFPLLSSQQLEQIIHCYLCASQLLLYSCLSQDATVHQHN